MNFVEFKSSLFFKIGQSRFYIFGHPTSPEHFCMFDSMTVKAPDSSDPIISDFTIPAHKKITPFHLRHALGLQKSNPKDPECIDSKFKEIIIKQWIEVTDICNQVLELNNQGITDPTKKLRLNVGKLLITEPGMPIGQHGHQVKQTLTMVYFFDEDQLVDGDPPNFIMGKDFQHKIYLPNSNKIIFSMKDDPLHYVFSNKWGFWWFNDFSNYFVYPPNLPFTYWHDRYLDSNNL